MKLKILWILIFMASFGMLMFELESIFKAYGNRTTLMSIKTKGVEKIRFPTVTICKGSAISRQGSFKAHTHLQNMILKEEMPQAERAFLAIGYYNQFSNQDELNKATTKPEEFFIRKLHGSCVFGIHHVCNYPKDITKIITSSYGGMCFQFNGKGNLQQPDVGSYYGLSLFMFVNQSDSIPFSSLDFGSGVVIKLHDPVEFPFPEDDGIFVSPGFLTRIALKKIIYKRLSAPYPSKCTDGKDVKLYYPGKYTTANCKRSCLVRDSLEDCGATDPLTMMLLNKTGQYELKNLNDTVLKCVFSALSRSTSSKRKKCVCPVPCQEVSYNPTISQTRWPSKADLPYFKYAFAHALGLNKSKVTEQFVYENFAQLNIYFDNMSSEEFEEIEEWTVQKVISDVGGQMGIWLGASILSLLEVLFSFVKVAARVLSGVKHKRKLFVTSSSVQPPRSPSV